MASSQKLTGFVFAAIGLGLALLCMSQMTVGTPLRVEYSGHPRDAVQVRQGTPFLVPPGFLFVPTALGVQAGTTQVSFQEVCLCVDGSPIATTFTALNAVAAQSSVVGLPRGFCAPAGSSVSVVATGQASDGCVWGFLERIAGLSEDRRPLRVEFVPRNDEAIVIREGSPVTIPSGKCLMVTALGGVAGHDLQDPQRYGLVVAGEIRVTAVAPSSYCVPPLAKLPSGLVIHAGNVVEPRQLHGAMSQAQAWGYLISTVN